MWDASQREVLVALGHVVYRPAGAPGSAPVARAVVAMDGLAMDGQAMDGQAPALLRALACAAGVPVDRLSGLPPLEQLRSAAAKRALWPRLRAMRVASRS